MASLCIEESRRLAEISHAMMMVEKAPSLDEC